MKTLEEYQKERMEKYMRKSLERREGKPLGVLCPKCEQGELWNSTPGSTLASNPPQIDILCKDCGYRGYAYA